MLMKPRKVNSEEQLATATAAKLEDGNARARLHLICYVDTPAIPSLKTRGAIQQRHLPQTPDRRDPPPPNHAVAQTPLTVKSATVLEEIRRFPAGFSGDPDSFTPQHLNDLVSNNTHSKLLQAVTSLVHLVLAGGLEQEVNEIIYGGRLIALVKKDGGLRSIAIGSTLRRLAAKFANKYATAKLKSHFAPKQLEVGTIGGAEEAIHAVRRYAEKLPKDDTIVKLDFKNAFNTLRRGTM